MSSWPKAALQGALGVELERFHNELSEYPWLGWLTGSRRSLLSQG